MDDGPWKNRRSTIDDRQSKKEDDGRLGHGKTIHRPSLNLRWSMVDGRMVRTGDPLGRPPRNPHRRKGHRQSAEDVRDVMLFDQHGRCHDQRGPESSRNPDPPVDLQPVDGHDRRDRSMQAREAVERVVACVHGEDHPGQRIGAVQHRPDHLRLEEKVEAVAHQPGAEHRQGCGLKDPRAQQQKRDQREIDVGVQGDIRDDEKGDDGQGVVERGAQVQHGGPVVEQKIDVVGEVNRRGQPQANQRVLPAGKKHAPAEEFPDIFHHGHPPCSGGFTRRQTIDHRRSTIEKIRQWTMDYRRWLSVRIPRG